MTMISRNPPPIMSLAIPGASALVSDDGPVGPPPGGVPPAMPGVPTAPRSDLGVGLITDVTEAARLADRASEMLAGVPFDDRGEDSSKDLRIRIYKTNVAAQSRIERQFDAGNPGDVVSQLRRADASLEDANWQLAKKPSPDGRFNGVDVPGAIRDTAEGVRILTELLRSATGSPGGAGPSAPPSPPSAPPPAPWTPPTGDAGSGYPSDDEFPPIPSPGG